MVGFTHRWHCSDRSDNNSSSKNLALPLDRQQNRKGVPHTEKGLLGKLVYFEEFHRIDETFYREKHIQERSRKKKEALINTMPDKSHSFTKCLNITSRFCFDSAQKTENERPLNGFEGKGNYANPKKQAAE